MLSMAIVPSKLHSTGFEFLNVLDILDMYYQWPQLFVILFISFLYLIIKNLRSKFYMQTDNATNSYGGLTEYLIDFLRKGPLDTGLKLNVHKTFRRHHGCLLNALCMFNLYSVPRVWKVVKNRSRLLYSSNSLGTNVLRKTLVVSIQKETNFLSDSDTGV